ncbi:MAG: hypothetical protein F4Z04_03030 [Acidobacteria bacterium]|nr:hypothetical protein [Acidobacteriota bacterium]
MLVELLVSTGIVLGLLGVVATLLDPSGGVLAVQTHAVDLHQRQRAALAELHRDLLAAGSGPHPGMLGTVAHVMPAVAPVLRGEGATGAVGADRLSVVYARSNASGARLAAPLPGAGGSVTVTQDTACRSVPCGLTRDGGGLAIVYDDNGRAGLYRITGRSGATVELIHVGGGPAGGTFAVGSRIAPVRVRGYYHDAGRQQIRVHNGAGADRPAIEGVARFGVRYYGADQPAPPPSTTLPAGPLVVPPGSPAPVPVALMAPCLAAAVAAGAPPTSRAAPIDLAELADGPWCGAGAALDVDQFRIRRIRVEVTLRVVDDAWRRAPPGTLGPRRSTGIRDVGATLDVTPRSLTSW